MTATLACSDQLGIRAFPSLSPLIALSGGYCTRRSPQGTLQARPAFASGSIYSLDRRLLALSSEQNMESVL